MPHPFRLAVEQEDIDAMLAAFRDDAVLHSPVAHHPIAGEAALRVLFGALFKVLKGFRYTDEINSDDGRVALIFRATVDGLDLEGLDFLRCDEDGKIQDITVMVRPRSAMEALRAGMAPLLAAANR